MIATFGVGVRRACNVIRFNRATYYVKSKAGPLNAMLRGRIKAIAGARVRSRYRRIDVLLRREGFRVSDKRVYRLYALGLSLRAKLPRRRRAAVARSQCYTPENVNEVWSLDFMHDRLADTRPYRLLTIVDIYSRECIALEVSPTILFRRRRERVAARLPGAQHDTEGPALR